MRKEDIRHISGAEAMSFIADNKHVGCSIPALSAFDTGTMIAYGWYLEDWLAGVCILYTPGHAPFQRSTAKEWVISGCFSSLCDGGDLPVCFMSFVDFLIGEYGANMVVAVEPSDVAFTVAVLTNGFTKFHKYGIINMPAVYEYTGVFPWSPVTERHEKVADRKSR